MARRDIGSGGGDSNVTQGTDPWNVKIDQTGSNNDVDVLSIAPGTNLIGKVQLRNPGNTADMGDTTTPLVVEGPEDEGTVATKNPFLASGLIKTGVDAGKIKSLQTAPDGDLIIHQQTGSVALTDNVGNTIRIPVNETDEGFFTYPVFPWWFDGTTWDRARGDATDGLLINLGLNNDIRISDGTDIADVFDLTNSNPLATAIVDASGNQITSFGGGTQYTEGDTDPSITGTAIMFESNTGTNTLSTVNTTTPLPVSDALAEASLSILDDWDESDRAKVNPIVGQAGVQGGSGTVTALTQRVVLSTDVGLPAGTNSIQVPRRASTTLTAINTTYNTTATETNTSATVSSSQHREGLFMAEVTVTGTPTEIEFTLQMSNDGTTWFDYRVGPWVKYRFDDATITAYGTMTICEPFMVCASNIRMKVTATGLLSGTNEFVVANGRFELVD